MSYFKDPQDNTIKYINIYEKTTFDEAGEPISGHSVNAKIICAPFSVPYEVNIGKTAAINSAQHAALKRGISALSGKPMSDNDINGKSPWTPWNVGEEGAESITATGAEKPSGKTLYPLDGAKEAPHHMFLYVPAWWDDQTMDCCQSVEFNNSTTSELGQPIHTFATPDWLYVNALDHWRLAGNWSRLEETNPILTQGGQPDPGFVSPGTIIKLKGSQQTQNFASDTTEGPAIRTHVEAVKNQSKQKINLFHERLSLRGPVTKMLLAGGAPAPPQSTNWPGFWSKAEFSLPLGTGFMAEIRNVENFQAGLAGFYRDAYFTINKPFLETAYEESLGEETGLSNPVKINAHYNFYLLPYEEAISDFHTNRLEVTNIGGDKVPMPEHLLPNMYALIHDIKSDEPSYRYWDQGSYMPISWWNGRGTPGPPTSQYELCFKKTDLGPHWVRDQYWGQEEEDIEKNIKPLFGPKSTIADYLNHFIKVTKKIDEPRPPNSLWKSLRHGGIKSPAYSMLEKKYHMTGISAYEMKNFMLEADKLKKFFPMHVDIELPAANSGLVGQILYESNLTDIFMQTVMAALWPRWTTAEKGGTWNMSNPTPWPDKFYGSLETTPPAALADTCLIRQDSYFKKDFKSDSVGNISSWENSLFSETLIKLWLNKLFDSVDPLLDLDSATAGPPGIQKYGGPVPTDEWYRGIPPQYWDWISSEFAPAHIEQIGKLRGAKHESQTISPLIPEAGSQTVGVRILKPVVFGKKPPSGQTLWSMLKWYAAKSKIVDLINSRARNVKEIYEGQEAYSEVLFYEIVKFKASDVGEADPSGKAIKFAGKTGKGAAGAGSAGLGFTVAGQQGADWSAVDQTNAPPGGPTLPVNDEQSFIQSIFIPNIPGMDTIKYIDTQIKFNKGYYYQIYAHTFVIGTQYQPDTARNEVPGFFDFGGGGGPAPGAYVEHWQFDYNYKPSVYLIRVPYYNTIVTANGAAKGFVDEVSSANLTAYNMSGLETTLMWDNPPVFPDAVFIPLYGEKDKVLLNATFNIGEYDLAPIVIDEGEVNNIAKCRINQKKLKDKITYKGDDFYGEIEILRIDKKPTSYNDFSPTSDTRIAALGKGKSNLGFIDNTIAPNKNYYYIVRERDVHGNLSNPSPVYLVRVVVKDGEAPYTIFKMFFMSELKEEKPKSLIEFMKYIKIKPTLSQRYLSEEEIKSLSSADIINNKSLINDLVGNEDLKQSVFGQKFRFRFTSKKTGRKFDLNLTVKDIKTLEMENKTTDGEPDKYDL